MRYISSVHVVSQGNLEDPEALDVGNEGRRLESSSMLVVRTKKKRDYAWIQTMFVKKLPLHISIDPDIRI